jgi:signal transduction histidine kinase
VDQPTILIISDDVEFPRTINARWQSEVNLPAFTVMKADLCRDLDETSFELAVVGAIADESVPAVLDALASAQKPAIFVCHDPERIRERTRRPGIALVRQSEAWVDTVVLLAGEMLRRVEAVARAKRAEQTNASLERHATLGRYILEMRHTINNALTSVLGNSELLLLEPGALSAEIRLQIEIIRNMALRVNEVMQRLTSIEKEMSAMEKVTTQRQIVDARAHVAS